MSRPTPISDLESHTGYWLRLVSNHVSHAFRLKMESSGVTVAEWVVMRAMFDADGLHPSELAESLSLTRGAVSKLCDRLAVKGFVMCKSEKHDRRYQVLHLTAAGRKLVPTLAALADQNDKEFFGHLGRKEQALLVATLKAIVRGRDLKGAPVD